MPIFVAGQSKIPGSGRPAGRLSKRARFAVELMNDTNVNPLHVLLKTWKNKHLPLEIRLDCIKAALPFCFPKLSAITSQVRSEVNMISIDRIRDNPKLAEMAETLALELVAQPFMLEAPPTECIDV